MVEMKATKIESMSVNKLMNSNDKNKLTDGRGSSG
jgi:hypothetical protein